MGRLDLYSVAGIMDIFRVLSFTIYCRFLFFAVVSICIYFYALFVTRFVFWFKSGGTTRG